MAAGQRTLSTQMRACTNCVRAKAKCSINDSANGLCQRCLRMNKDCQASPPVRRRMATSKLRNSKSSQLEAKIDGLVSLMKLATQVPAGAIDVDIDSSSESFAHMSQDSPSSMTDCISTCLQEVAPKVGHTTIACPILTPDSHHTPSSQHNITIPSILEPTLIEAESYLTRFQTHCVPQFPFISLPPNLSAKQLRESHPLLWMSIMAVGSNDTKQQIALSKTMRCTIGHEAFVEGTRNMDFLLAILVYVSWDRHQTFDRLIVTNLIQLAIAILYDLGLDKASTKDPALIVAYELKGAPKPARLLRSPTMEERRAYLACFILSSGYSCFKKGNSLPWTAYSEECLHTIETQRLLTSDALLVQLVKLRLLADKVAEAPWALNLTDVEAHQRPPAHFYMKSLESQLLELKANFPSSVSENRILLTEVFSIELAIYELGLSQLPGIFSLQYNRRIEYLWRCLTAARYWLDNFLGIPPVEYLGFSILQFANMSRAFISTYRLSTFDHPEWDHEHAKETLGVSTMLEQVASNLAQVKNAAGLDPNNSSAIDSYSLSASRFRQYKTTWDTMAASATAPYVNMANNEMRNDPNLPFLDDNWLDQIFGPGHREWA